MAVAAFVLALASTSMVSVVLFRTAKAAVTGKLFGPDPVVSVCLEQKAK